MKHTLKKKAWLSFLATLSLIYCGCATQKKIPPEQAALILPQQHLEAGEYSQAIAAFDSAYRANPGNTAIKEAFARCLERIRQTADQAFEKNDYSQAEKTYSLLLENLRSIRDLQELLAFSEKYLNDRIKESRVAPATRRARQALKTGEFDLALAEMKSLVQIYPDDPDVRTSLVNLSRDIKRTADLALAREDYAIAGKASHALLKGYSLLEKTGTGLPFSRADLDNAIKTCRIQLTRKGLELYRRGNLAEAIFLWQGLLAFDPDNVEIKKAVQTATEQLKKIKKK
ncbi:MAG: tetratricopeptide repeat protein [Clostridiales bacterium]|nr:tetratricopeptide repeat protein [Clostridiales bacterium]